MGYHIQILRTRHGKADPITRSEIETLVSSASGLRVEASSLSAADLDLVVSKGSKDVSRLTLQHGQLWTKNPEDDEIQVMIDVAAQLGARVRSDEFETFRSVTDTYAHPDDREEFDRSEAESKRATGRIRRNRSISWFIRITALAVLVIGYWVSRGRS